MSDTPSIPRSWQFRSKLLILVGSGLLLAVFGMFAWYMFPLARNERNESKGNSMGIQVDGEGNPILDQFSQDGFVDLTFRITKLVRDGQHYRFHLAASYRNSTVGMDVVLLQSIQGGIDAEMNLAKENVYGRGVRLLRSGSESDRLISAISELYGSPDSIKKMVDEETFTAIALQQGHLDFDNQAVKLKIFGNDREPFDEDAYYETFFNVDIPKGFVYWNEKDPDYRKPLLQGLSRN